MCWHGAECAACSHLCALCSSHKQVGVCDCVQCVKSVCRCAEGGQGDLRWGEWDSVSCYACGLASIDPETDEEVRMAGGSQHSERSQNELLCTREPIA